MSMSIWVNTETGEQLNECGVRALAENTVMAAKEYWDEATLASLNVASLVVTPKPQVEPWEWVSSGAPTNTGGVWETTWTVNSPTLEQARDYKLKEIEADYESDKSIPINAYGADWKGGFESAQGVDSAARMAAKMGATTVTLYDVRGVTYTKTIAEAEEVALAIGTAFQTIYGIAAGRRVAVSDAKTITEVLSI